MPVVPRGRGDATAGLAVIAFVVEAFSDPFSGRQHWRVVRIATDDGRRIGQCPHWHRTPEAARACARKVARL